ncbi:glycosyltransferase family 2 protein [Roseovarius pacificus]|uniref:glycosyltransferase family 2 protein n=1 Tax=Roseovarius pacificus TaxID=337701 RepID=UPI002A18AF98|nr:glycosyltransferase family 2 protein [Roseovarius pacificus]
MTESLRDASLPPGVTRHCRVEAADPEISFFVPCLNEEPNVAGALDAILAATRAVPVPFEILVVDDHSADDTVAVVRACMDQRETAPIVLVTNDTHRGLGHNYAMAARLAKGRYYMLVNGDNVERTELIAEILARLGKADIVIPYFGRLDQRPWKRRVVSRTFTIIVNLLSGQRIHYYNGAVAHLRENVLAHHPGTRGFGHQAELITKLLYRGATYTEVEVPMQERQHGHSSAFRWQNFVSVCGSLWRILRNRFLPRQDKQA